MTDEKRPDDELPANGSEEIEPNPPLPDGGPRDGTEAEEDESWPEG
jgi:hypothetical protein